MAPEAKATQEASDEELMAAVAGGDLASMSGIYERRNRALFRFFYRMTGRQALAEDLTQDVFLRMIRYRHTYSCAGRPREVFEAWMYRIARNAWIDYRRKHRLETEGGEDEMEAVASGQASALDNVTKQQDLALLHRALKKLPDEKRELILMSRFQGLNYEQIGRILGCEAGTIKGRMFRAMKEMSRIYTELAQERAS